MKCIFMAIVMACSFGQLSFTQHTELSYENLKDSVNSFVFNEPAKSLKFAELYLSKAIQANDNDHIAKGYKVVTTSYYFLKDFKRAQQEGKNLLRHTKSTNNHEMTIEALIQNADIEMLLNEIDYAQQLLLEAVDLADSIENDLYRETALAKLAGYYDLSGNTDKAIDMRMQTIRILKQRETDSSFTEKEKFQTIIYTYGVLASSYLKLKEFDSVEVYNENVRALALANDTCKLIYYYTIKGEIALAKDDFEQANENFKTSLNYCPPDNAFFALNMAFRFGRAQYGLSNFEQTKAILEEGLEKYEVSEAEEAYMDEYYKLLAESHKALGDFERANHYFEKYIHTQTKLGKLKGDISNSLNAKEIADFQKELNEQIAAKESEKNTFYYLALASLLLVIVLLFVLLRFYKTRRKNELKFKELLSTHSPQKDEVTKSELIVTDSQEIGVSQEVFQQIIDGLADLKEKKYFLSQDCSTYNVAKKIKTNTTYLSKVVNAHFNQNFNAYLNDLRINYAIVKLKDDKSFRAYSVQGIAEELGYKSADSFTKYFKAKTGLNPSFYIKQLDAI